VLLLLLLLLPVAASRGTTWVPSSGLLPAAGLQLAEAGRPELVQPPPLGAPAALPAEAGLSSLPRPAEMGLLLLPAEAGL
jgi:hypothetical protein